MTFPQRRFKPVPSVRNFIGLILYRLVFLFLQSVM